jgi:magnesium-transporting ATPase (P-type)
MAGGAGSLARLEADQAFFEFEFVGVLSLNDPPRTDSKTVLAELQQLGVRVVMLTGDALAIARTVAVTVGLGDRLQSLVEWRKMCKENPKLEVPDITGTDCLHDSIDRDDMADGWMNDNRIGGVCGDLPGG